MRGVDGGIKPIPCMGLLLTCCRIGSYSIGRNRVSSRDTHNCTSIYHRVHGRQETFRCPASPTRHTSPLAANTPYKRHELPAEVIRRCLSYADVEELLIASGGVNWTAP
jgi:hypothetical protein